MLKRGGPKYIMVGGNSILNQEKLITKGGGGVQGNTKEDLPTTPPKLIHYDEIKLVST